MTKQLQLQNDLLEFLDYGESIRIRPTEILMNVESPYNEWVAEPEYIPQMCFCEEICRDGMDGQLFVRAGKYQTTLISELRDNDIDKIYDVLLNSTKQ